MAAGGTAFHRVRRAAVSLVDFLYPHACALCHRRLPRGQRTLCHCCMAEMRLDAAWECPRCGARGHGAAPEAGRRCRLCPPEGAAWQGVLAACGYNEAAARCVQLFKYHRRRELGEAMASIMWHELPPMLEPLRGRINVVAPVPIHWCRRLWRGFNQSDLLAQAVAGIVGVPCRLHLMRRVRHTRRQALLPRESRPENVRGAFAVHERDAVEAAGVLLVDDVVTSGSTVGECARVLRGAGAREVWIACFARAGVGERDLDDWVQDMTASLWE